MPKSYINCEYLMDQTNESVPQDCGGCTANKLASVWQCELHGKVAPVTRGPLKVDDVLRCDGCRDYSIDREVTAFCDYKREGRSTYTCRRCGHRVVVSTNAEPERVCAIQDLVEEGDGFILED